MLRHHISGANEHLYEFPKLDFFLPFLNRREEKTARFLKSFKTVPILIDLMQFSFCCSASVGYIVPNQKEVINLLTSL